MTHTLIVPGVGGSEYNHWQTCLQHQLMRCSVCSKRLESSGTGCMGRRIC